ncbi:hypothetical protein HOM50_04860 [bacterium]|jgi:hypothetical protein|nr:hypothetical protein [bacterium]MBT5015711.1 hypothetical protein [bacterium]
MKKTLSKILLVLNLFSIVNVCPNSLELMPAKNYDDALTPDFFRYIKQTFNIVTFIETGTCSGESVKFASPIFSDIHSVELSDHLFKRCENMFKNQSHIHIYHGDSAATLPQMVKGSQGKILFFLDAHWSSGDTARGEENTPIKNELRAIKQSNVSNAVIIVDDMRFFSKYNTYPSHRDQSGYPTLNETIALLKDINPHYQIVIYGDVLIAFDDDSVEISPAIKIMTQSRLEEENQTVNNNVELGLKDINSVDKEFMLNLYKRFCRSDKCILGPYILWKSIIDFYSSNRTEAYKSLNLLKKINYQSSKIESLTNALKTS